MDKALATFVLANGAAATGQKVTIFFTFWGLNVFETSWLPVELHHAAASRGNPGSVAVISTRSPEASMSIVFWRTKIVQHCYFL